MKSFKLLIVVLFLFSFSGFSQTLTGLWVGSLTNDSSTVRRDQSFEMALTEYKGKIYGYSHTTFMVHDTLFYIVKRVKGTINGNVAEVKDDELVSCNFMTKMDKGVKQNYTFRLSTEDSLWRLDGEWKTNKTKNYYSISGSVKTATEKDLTKSKLFPHLQELNLTDAVATLNPPKTEPAKQPEVQPTKKEEKIAKKETIAKQPDEKSIAKVEQKKNDTTTASSTAKKEEATSVKNEPITTTPKTETVKATTEPIKKPEENKPKTDVAVKQQEVKKQEAEKEIAKAKQTAITEPAKQTETAISKPKEIPVVVAKPAAENVAKRRSETIQAIEFKSDSITLSLYDNGEIDGDTVSVLINGEVVLAQQGLRATAIRKTIQITPAMKDSFTLVLYAENLGRYAPNTGLILVRDGEDVHEVRFSADMQKNVAVIFKRKKK